LVTDPIPYEPAENIPPLILPETEPDPTALYEVRSYEPFNETSVHFRVVIRDYNVNDTLYLRLVNDDCSDQIWERFIAPSGAERDRAYEFDLPAPAASECTRVMLVVSDHGWNPESPPYCDPLEDEDQLPVTTVARAQWWIWVSTVSGSDGPPVTSCGAGATH
jgi:hypothetical protein